ncbi:MAG: hypothetical protein IT573_04805 [Deltaproteobacteria bacterium]|nr:hypothetical protein [Deltaproteobacteria bacterium]
MWKKFLPLCCFLGLFLSVTGLAKGQTEVHVCRMAMKNCHSCCPASVRAHNPQCCAVYPGSGVAALSLSQKGEEVGKTQTKVWPTTLPQLNPMQIAHLHAYGFEPAPENRDSVPLFLRQRRLLN